VTIRPPSVDVLKAAYYKAYAPTLTQQEIAVRARLGTQAQVSRLLNEARERKILREVFQFPEGVEEDVKRQVENSFFEKHAELEEALVREARQLRSIRSNGGSPFRRLHVVAAPGLEKPEEREKAFQSFGISAAEIVADYIDEAEMCCVAWGRTIEATVRHVRPRSEPHGHKLFIPIAGEPTNHEPNGVSPSDAARILSSAWSNSGYYSLRGVQARIPKSVGDSKIARDLVGYSNKYREIFGSEDSSDRLISQVPMILTGIGDVKTSQRKIDGDADGADPWYLETADPWYLETEEAEDQSVLNMAAGNIGGVWLPRSELPKDQQLKVWELNERWLGAQLEDFSRCSISADAQNPGVVVLAAEPEKLNIVLEALYLINILIVSRQLAQALADKLLSGH
jgi:DNA-binding transcriptional regulator LsrR (DeoR family)